ncbi:hypothetical protein DCAR_0518691 [Daucus carota subsp. sativus]|uniref:Uncharacterized protein n=1 Tax=Daucus carota subsp. sativus TaxID=79200 RepID=A0AAF1AXU0_DAUCS|nr:hypothetical protein DCAR_0518691 [Daucus carota subsp. sativus]
MILMAPTSLCFLILLTTSLVSSSSLTDPTPKPWPLQFHSTMIAKIENGTQLEILNLWYDWPNGISMSIVQKQLGKLLYGPEWNNGTSFFYALDSSEEPNWIEGAKYVGQEYMDGFLCNVWNKVDFIIYYEDVVSKRPVAWFFVEGGSEHIMTFEVGKVLDQSYWQAPVYCFDDAAEQKKNANMDILNSGAAVETGAYESFMRSSLGMKLKAAL